MKSFEEVINNGAVRWDEKERECLRDHVPNHENGVFKIGKLGIIATTEHVNGAIMEHVSISRAGIRKPNTEEIEMVKELFWNVDEVSNVSRLYIPSDVIHLRRTQIVHTA